jgi:uncharacterized protein (DUF3084 family)
LSQVKVQKEKLAKELEEVTEQLRQIVTLASDVQLQVGQLDGERQQLLSALKSMKDRMDALEEENAELKKKNEEIEQEMERIASREKAWQQEAKELQERLVDNMGCGIPRQVALAIV